MAPAALQTSIVPPAAASLRLRRKDHIARSTPTAHSNGKDTSTQRGATQVPRNGLPFTFSRAQNPANVSRGRFAVRARPTFVIGLADPFAPMTCHRDRAEISAQRSIDAGGTAIAKPEAGQSVAGSGVTPM